MKKIILTITTIFICTIAYAHTINWHVGDTILQTTTCESGESITPPTAPYKYGYHFVKWAEYIPIEYLESTGTQYIDTGVIGNINTEYEITVKNNYTYSSSSFAIFGSRTSATENNIMSTFYVGGNASSMTNDFGNYNITRQIPTRTSAEILHRYKITNGKSQRIITDLDTGWTDTVTTEYSGSLTTPTNLCIGYAGSLVGMTNVSNLKGNIYGCKIWNNGTLVRDFIPVLDKDGVPCMYDRVEKKFYYNAGTGQFIAGPVIGE